MVELFGLVILVKFLALAQVISGSLAKTAGPWAVTLQPSVARPTFLATVGSFLPHLQMPALSRCVEKQHPASDTAQHASAGQPVTNVFRYQVTRRSWSRLQLVQS